MVCNSRVLSTNVVIVRVTERGNYNTSTLTGFLGTRFPCVQSKEKVTKSPGVSIDNNNKQEENSRNRTSGTELQRQRERWKGKERDGQRERERERQSKRK